MPTRELKILQAGFPKSGNYWLYRVLCKVLQTAGHAQPRFIHNHPVYPLAKTWPLSYKTQADIDMIDILYEGAFFRISSRYREKIDNFAAYAAQTSHVWTHANFCERSHQVFPHFSHIIYIIRDPRDVALSQARFAFTPYMQQFWPCWHSDPGSYLQAELASTVADWQRHVRGYLQQGARHNIHFVFYEHLLRDFNHELQRLLSWLGISLSAEQQQHIAEETAFTHMKKQSPGHVQKARLYHWQQQLESTQKKQVLETAGDLLQQLRYPLEHGHRLPRLPRSPLPRAEKNGSAGTSAEATSQAPSLAVASFLQRQQAGAQVLDVRSPTEFEKGHIPGALNLPLFSDEERAVVGTLYKQENRQAALEKGLELVGPKMKDFVQQARQLARGRELLVHCWRGGMRSGSMAWLLQTAGLQVTTLQGGYKAYRHLVALTFQQPWQWQVVGGRTGSGKSLVLQQLSATGAQVLDLEGLACHKGSAFGALQMPPQPSSEHFANLLHGQLLRMDPARPIWLEDESATIGSVHLPEQLFKVMQQAPLFVLEVPLKDRLQILLQGYGSAPVADLLSSFKKIKKKLGGKDWQTAITALQQGDLQQAASLALQYYDRAYDKDLRNKAERPTAHLSFQHFNAEAVARKLLQSRQATAPKA